MALSEIQKSWLTKDVLYRHVMGMISQLDKEIGIERNRLEYLNQISSTDLDDILVPAETQTLLATMRTELNILLTYYDNNFASIADQIRIM